MNNILSLPPEIICNISKFLPKKDFGKFILTNRQIFHNLRITYQNTVLSIWTSSDSKTSMGLIYYQINLNNFPNSKLNIAKIPPQNFKLITNQLIDFISYYDVTRIINFMQHNDVQTNSFLIENLNFNYFNLRQINLLVEQIIGLNIQPKNIKKIQTLIHKIDEHKLERFFNYLTKIENIKIPYSNSQNKSRIIFNILSNKQIKFKLKKFRGLQILDTLELKTITDLSSADSQQKLTIESEKKLDNFVELLKSVETIDFLELENLKPIIKTAFINKLLETNFAPKKIKNLTIFLNGMNQLQIEKFVPKLKHSISFDFFGFHDIEQNNRKIFIEEFLKFKSNLESANELPYIFNYMDNTQIDKFINISLSNIKSIDFLYFDTFNYDDSIVMDENQRDRFINTFLKSNIKLDTVTSIHYLLDALSINDINHFIRKIESATNISFGFKLELDYRKYYEEDEEYDNHYDKIERFINKFLFSQIKIKKISIFSPILNFMNIQQVKQFAQMFVNIIEINDAFELVDNRKLKVFIDELIQLKIKPQAIDLINIIFQLSKNTKDKLILRHLLIPYFEYFNYLDNISFSDFNKLSTYVQGLFKQEFFDNKFKFKKVEDINQLINTLNNDELRLLKPKLHTIKFNNDFDLFYQINQNAADILFN